MKFRILKTKKAQVEPTDLGKKIPYYSVVIIMLGLMASMFACSASKLNYQQAETPSSLSDLMITTRIINSAECLAYMDDEISRAYPGVIDIMKFKDTQIKKCIKFGANEDCYKIKLYDSSERKNYGPISTGNINSCSESSEKTYFKKSLGLLRLENKKMIPVYIQVIKYHTKK